MRPLGCRAGRSCPGLRLPWRALPSSPVAEAAQKHALSRTACVACMRGASGPTTAGQLRLPWGPATGPVRTDACDRMLRTNAVTNRGGDGLGFVAVDHLGGLLPCGHERQPLRGGAKTLERVAERFLSGVVNARSKVRHDHDPAYLKSDQTIQREKATFGKAKTIFPQRERLSRCS